MIGVMRMPRGEHPNSLANLKRPSTNEARKRGAKGGKKSAEVRKELKTFRELDEEVTTNEERIEMLNSLKRRARYNNKAFEIYRDTVGLKPDERLQIELAKLELLARKIAGPDAEAADDGFLDALNAEAAELWGDTDDENE